MQLHTVSAESFLRPEEGGGGGGEHDSRHDPQTNDGESENTNEHAPPYQPDEDEEALPPYERRNNNDRLRSTPLHRNWWMLVPTALYAAIAVYSWVYLCLLSRTGDLTTNVDNRKVNQYKAARILHVIVAITTIPMVSAVCSWAAAVYVQNQRDAYSLRLRQVMVLADRMWMNPLAWLRLVCYESGFQRYGSGFLYLAMFISLIGVVTYPVQSLFLLSTRQVSVKPLDKWGRADYDFSYKFVNTVPAMLDTGYFPAGETILAVRRELQTEGIDGQFPQIWGTTDSLSSIKSSMNTTWFAEFPNTFSTGPFGGQYVPRVNSSTTIENLTVGEFPSGCAENTDWFYALYTYPFTVSEYNSTVEVCLAVNGTASPWNNTNGRQDFSEVLYLNATNDENNYGVGAVKIIMDTTAGLFELPNLANNGQPGPIDSNSTQCVGIYCSDSTLTRRQVSDIFQPALPGPLTVIALALFGPGSWADLQQNSTTTYGAFANETGWNQYLNSYMAEDDTFPLEPLGLNLGNGFYGDIDGWLGALTYTQDGDVGATSAFTRAAFLATKSIFDSSSGLSNAQVMYNTSALQQIALPSLSSSGLIVGSVLFALYLIPLLAMAVYAAMTPRWTISLNAFTMLRMGAALGQKDLPLLVGYRTGKIQALDSLPGVVRDISGPDDAVRQLALGVEGGKPLHKKTRYLAYPGNNDKYAPGNARANNVYR